MISIISPCGVEYYWETINGLRGWYTREEIEQLHPLPPKELLDAREEECDPAPDSE